MIKSELTFRVRYNEVDRMGYVHHGNYAAYFEMGRTELMREKGLTYKGMEDSGILLPLSEFYVKYYVPALYDDLLRMETTLQSFKGVRLIFEYKIFKQDNSLVAEGKTPLAFVNSNTRKPMRPPQELIDLFNNSIRES
jgi:acyl-CoA thioester hydrolase